MTKRLHAKHAQAMAAIHATGFETGWPEEDMKRHIEKDIVVGSGDPLTGFLILRPAADQAELLTLAVLPGYRRSGLATKLIIAGENSAQKSGVDVIFLEVAEDNPGAIALYRKNKYQEFARRPAYYKRTNGRVAALLFRKQI